MFAGEPMSTRFCSAVTRKEASGSVAKLPDLSITSSTEINKATGTDDLTLAEAAAHLQRPGTAKEQNVSLPAMHTVRGDR